VNGGGEKEEDEPQELDENVKEHPAQ